MRTFVDLAREAGTTPARLALAWCLAQPGVDAVIVGVTRPDQIRDNAAAADLELDDALVRRIGALFCATPAGD